MEIRNQLKSVKKFRRWMVGGAACLMFGVVSYQVVSHPPSFLKVQEVIVATPLQHISDFDLIRLSGVLKGDNLATIRLKKIRSNLRRFPWIREIEISKRVPGRLFLTVQEEVPVALLEREGLFLVNEEGVVFKKMEEGDPKDLPIITGIMEQEIHSQLKLMISFLQMFEGSDVLKSIGISEIHRAEDGSLSLLTKDPRMQVQLGREDWAKRIDRFEQVWGTIQATARAPQVVDVSYDKRIIVKQGGT